MTVATSLCHARGWHSADCDGIVHRVHGMQLCRTHALAYIDTKAPAVFQRHAQRAAASAGYRVHIFDVESVEADA
jgi:hypothetical protein